MASAATSDGCDKDARLLQKLVFHDEDEAEGVAELIGADNGTFATEIAMPTADRDFHALRDPATWMAAARSVPPWREWLDPQRSEPRPANHASSRRQPHPPQRAGQHRPTTTLHSSTKRFSGLAEWTRTTPV